MLSILPGNLLDILLGILLGTAAESIEAPQSFLPKNRYERPRLGTTTERERRGGKREKERERKCKVARRGVRLTVKKKDQRVARPTHHGAHPMRDSVVVHSSIPYLSNSRRDPAPRYYQKVPAFVLLVAIYGHVACASSSAQRMAARHAINMLHATPSAWRALGV